MPGKKNGEAPDPELDDEERLDEELEQLARGRDLDASDLASLGGEGREDAEDDEVVHDDEENEWNRDAWSDYMSTRAAVRSDGGNGGGFFYE